VAALLSSFASLVRSLLPRRVSTPLPTMHSLRVHGGSFCTERRRAPALRIVRNSGRIVISGRMADVCAELDRLAALESAGAA
jgi:hypothetical protein